MNEMPHPSIHYGPEGEISEVHCTNCDDHLAPDGENDTHFLWKCTRCPAGPFGTKKYKGGDD
jgi:hypothetical protein